MKHIITIILFLTLSLHADETFKLKEFNCSIIKLENWNEEKPPHDSVKLLMRSQDQSVVTFLLAKKIKTNMPINQFLERYKDSVINAGNGKDIKEKKIKINENHGLEIYYNQSIQNLKIQKILIVTIIDNNLYHIDVSGINVELSSYPDVKKFITSFQVNKK